jgi:hypothetical protein
MLRLQVRSEEKSLVAPQYRTAAIAPKAEFARRSGDGDATFLSLRALDFAIEMTGQNPDTSLVLLNVQNISARI